MGGLDREEAGDAERGGMNNCSCGCRREGLPARWTDEVWPNVHDLAWSERRLGARIEGSERECRVWMACWRRGTTRHEQLFMLALWWRVGLEGRSMGHEQLFIGAYAVEGSA
jgi:hypothetical protein